MTPQAPETPSLLDLTDPPPRANLNEIESPPNPALASTRWKPAAGEVPPHIEIRMKEGKQWDRFLNLRAVTKQNRECSDAEASQIAYEIVLRVRSRYDVYLTKADLLKREEKAREKAQRKAEREAERSKKTKTDPVDAEPPSEGEGQSESIWLKEKRRSGQLIHKDQIAGAHATPRKIVEWVFQHLYVDGVTSDDAPSAGAWGLLNFARANSDNERELIQMWTKLLPTKAELERGDKQQDDGRDVIGTLQRIRAKCAEPPAAAELDPDDEVQAE